MAFGHPTYFFESLPSTNDYASLLISEKEVSEGTVIDTAHQTHGHGQKDRVWYSVANENITLSLVLKPRWLSIESQFLLNLMASLAIVDTVVEVIGINAKVKWPNDVYVNKKKISGILIKNQLQGSTMQSSIVGIGLNVMQKKWPDGVTNATSLIIESQDDVSIDNVKTLLLSNLEKLYLQIQADPKHITEKYNHQLFLKDQETLFMHQDEVKKGVIRHIDKYGRLLIEQNDTLVPYGYGEITFHK